MSWHDVLSQGFTKRSNETKIEKSHLMPKLSNIKGEGNIDCYVIFFKLERAKESKMLLNICELVQL